MCHVIEQLNHMYPIVLGGLIEYSCNRRLKQQLNLVRWSVLALRERWGASLSALLNEAHTLVWSGPLTSCH